MFLLLSGFLIIYNGGVIPEYIIPSWPEATFVDRFVLTSENCIHIVQNLVSFKGSSETG